MRSDYAKLLDLKMLAKEKYNNLRSQLKVKFRTLYYNTKDKFTDITKDIEKVIKSSKILNGLALVFSKHTTAGIIINENEPLLLEDMKRFLDRLASPDGEYEHNNFEKRTVNMCDEECKNGHSHCQHIPIGTSEIIPIKNANIVLGKWQRIFLVELDHPRQREVLVEILGQ